MDLSNFFGNPFHSSRLIDDDLRQFSQDHLQRLAKASAYPALLGELTTAYSDYFGAITDEDTATAVRISLTQTVNDAVADFKDAASRYEGSVRSQYGKDAAVYLEFYPQGVTEYREATLGELETLMQRLSDAFTRHSADLGAAKATTFTSLLTRFQTARNAQLSQKGAVSANKSGTSDAREVVEKQLMRSIHTIALDFIGDPAGALVFFDQSLVRTPAKVAAPVVPVVPPT